MVLTFEEYNVVDAAERCRELPENRSGGDRDPRGQGILVSVPGGAAYTQVMKRVESDAIGAEEKKCLFGQARGKGVGAATVWFGEDLVFGQTARHGWVHPFEACGRDDVPVPDGPLEGMWDSLVEGGGGRSAEPEVGRRYPCWCCRWLAATDEWHKEGYQLYCVTSNIYEPEWVGRWAAGSSERPEEEFQNVKPAGWGSGNVIVESSEFCPGPEQEYDREAKTHPDTGLPLGHGCRWERQCMDAKPYEVRCFFLP